MSSVVICLLLFRPFVLIPVPLRQALSAGGDRCPQLVCELVYFSSVLLLLQPAVPALLELTDGLLICLP